MNATLVNIIILQLIAHFLADFIILNDKNSREKNSNGIRSKHLYIHIAVVTFLSFVFSANLHFWWCSLVIGSLHFVTDASKAKTLKLNCNTRWVFFIDQIVHIVIITIVSWIFVNSWETPAMLFEYFGNLLRNTQLLLYVLGYLLCLKPSNIIVMQIISKWMQEKDVNDGELENAGKLIGIIERVLTLTFVILNQYSAIGFLLAAKSILRFKETTGQKRSEYVLLGTLLSFSIAIFIGIIIKVVINNYNP